MAEPKTIQAEQSPDFIYDSLKERICLLDCPPGMQLSEPALAAEYGVSRTPVREALKRLAAEDLVESRNGVGTLVRAFSLAELEDIYAMRQKIAGMIGEMSPRPIRASHKRKLDDLHCQSIALRNGRDARSLSRINHDLHILILSLIGNRALADIFDRYYHQTSRLWFSVIDEIWGEEVEALVAETEALQTAFRYDDLMTVGFVKRNFIALSIARVKQVLAH